MNVLVSFAFHAEDYKGFIQDFDEEQEVKDFFENLKPNGWFYVISRIAEIDNVKKIYFRFDGKIIACADYMGNKNEDEKENEKKRKFANGYEIENIQIFDKPIKINNDFFGRTHTYITTEDRKKEIEKAKA